jgi:signal transduction histidine kinase
VESTSRFEATVSRPGVPKRAGAGPQFSSKVPLEIPSHSRLVGWAVLVAIGFFGLQTGLQWLMYGGDVHWATGAISAACVGALSLWLFEGIRHRQMLHKARFEAIAEANHHINNALAAIQARFFLMEADPEHMKEMEESVDRICWVVNEVLPEDRQQER